MKTSDYMIGDWVRPSCWNEQVLLVGEGRITVNSDSYLEDEIKPISLTAEILERNGFVQRNEYYHITIENKDTRYCVEYDIENKKLTVNNVWFVINEVRYVHELQHALRLCRIDKEIIL